MGAEKETAIRVVRWSPGRRNRTVAAFLERPAIDEQAEKVAREVLEGIRIGGDRALLAYLRRFDGARLSARRLHVSAREWDEACSRVGPDFRRAVRLAHQRIARFARAGLRRDWEMRTPLGGRLGECFVPLERVGIYIPGGVAPLASSVLMTVPLAKAAGVREIIVCTPADRHGHINPHILYAARYAGAHAVYRVGGIQAIAAMAYGTATIGRVQKIVGPGGPYVTAAKRLVYGRVALDMVAGPSEIAILADESADAGCVAMDLLSQLEHGSGHEKALLVTDAPTLAQRTRKEVWRQAAALPTAGAIRRVLAHGLLLVIVPGLPEGVELCNRFAPEHLEIQTRRPRSWAGRIRAAGAVFVGPWTPESAGDYVAGPSHVLPTGGTASFFSGLTADDFRRRTSILELKRAELQEVWPAIKTFGRVEGMEAHVRSAKQRLMAPQGSGQ